MKRHSIEEIIWIMRRIEKSGLNISAACQAHHITRMTYYRWLKKYRALAPPRPSWENPHANQFAEENAQLKILVAEQALDICRLKQMLSDYGRPGIEHGEKGPPTERFDYNNVIDIKGRITEPASPSSNRRRHPSKTQI